MPPRHDRLFKRLLRFFLPDLLRLVVPSLALGKPGGGSVLVHVEVEARSRTRMLRRLREYAGRIQARYGGPVLSILVNLRGGTPGIQTMAPDGEIAGPGLNSFRYMAFNLSGCRAEDYLSKPEPLAWGLAPLMAPGPWSRAEHKLACLQRIDAGRLDEQRRLLLVDCVETYLVLTPEEMEEYKRLSPREREKPMNPMRDLTWSERMIADGMRQIVLHQMDQRFGPLPEPIRKKVEGIYSATRLTRLADKLLVAGSLDELGIR